MHTKIWLAQPNNGKKLHTLLQTIAAVCVLWGLGAGIYLFAMRRNLRAAQEETLAHHQQASALMQSLREKQTTAAQANGLHTGAPDSEGASDWAAQIQQQAASAGVKIESLHMHSDDHAPAMAAGSKPPNAVPGANAAPNSADAAKDTEDSGPKVKFECSAVGSFRQLTAFLNGLTEAPYIAEIAQAEMAREKFDAKAGVLLRLHLSLNLCGQPTKP